MLAGVLTLAACGGGGSGITTDPAPVNQAPTAIAGANQSVDELANVTLDGSSSSDPENTALTYAWTQTAGTTVTITNSSAAQASFDAPDVTAVTVSETLTFQLSVSDGARSATATTDVVVNDVGLGVNSPPVSNAGGDQTVAELSNVNLNGSASSDADGDALTYAWLQTAGSNVVLSDVSIAQPSFTSPDVTAPETLTFELTVNDGTDSVADTVDINVVETLSAVTVAGKLQFEWVNPNANCQGLDLNNPVPRDMRGVTVQLLDSGNIILGTTFTANDGSYSFSNIDANLDVKIRVRAELLNGGAATWNVEVRDNTSNTGSPLTARPLYVLEFPEFNTGAVNIADADFTARTGWDSGSYSGTRAAAPFAILDSIMDAMTMVTNVDPTVTFSPLDVYWSVNNRLTSPSDIDAGELSSTFYTNNGLYMLGDVLTDTEEFDDHVSIHEWGHYFEDNFSRSDSIGGAHIIGAPLDPRVAFGEGFASALAAIALDEPIYCDTNGNPSLLSGGFGVNWENPQGLQGWFNEWSTGAMIYDLWDTDVDGTDNSSIGFAPIYETMVGPQRTTSAFTTMFSFAAGLRPMLNASDLAFVDSQLSRINVDTPAVVDIWGESQLTAPTNATFPDGRGIVPPYTELQVGAAAINVCLNNDYFSSYADGDGENKLGMYKFFRFTTSGTASYTITATANPAPVATTGAGSAAPRDDSDPDLFLHRSGQGFPFANSTADGDAVEVLTTPSIAAGTYLLLLQEWRHVDEDRVPGFPAEVCFDVSVGL